MQFASHNSEAPFVSHHSEAQGLNNEDFHFDKKLSNAHVLVVGDFARSAFPGLDKLAKSELEGILKNGGVSVVPPPEMLADIAIRFNNRLLEYRAGYKSDPEKRFQCCAVFAVISGTEFYYLPIGDCRVAVRRGDVLLLLNGTVWQDAAGNPLSTVITADQEVRRGPEERPSLVMGVHPLSLSRADVNKLDLAPDDQALLYSDGVDKAISPAQLLNILRDTRGNPSGHLAEAMVAKVLKEVRSNFGDDDRTMLVALGPYVNSATQTFAVELRRVEDELKTLKQQLPDIEKLNALVRNIQIEIRNVLSLSPKDYAIRNQVSNSIRQELEIVSNSIRQELAQQNNRSKTDEGLKTKIDNLVTSVNTLKTNVETISKKVDQKPQSVEPAVIPISTEIRDLIATLSLQIQNVDKKISPVLQILETDPTLSLPQDEVTTGQEESDDTADITTTKEDTDTLSEPGVDPQSDTPKTKWQAFKEFIGSRWPHSIKSNDVVFLSILAGASVFLLYLLLWPTQSSQNPASSTPSDQPKRYRLDYDTQKRWVTLIDTKQNQPSPYTLYRALFGQEQQFIDKTKDGSLQFDSPEQAIEWLDSPQERLRYVGKIDLIEIGQFEQSIWIVGERDIVPGNTTETLANIVTRINQVTPKGVRMTFDQLKKLNPGLGARQINPGDQLMYFSRKK